MAERSDLFPESAYHEPMTIWAGGNRWQQCQEDLEFWPCTFIREERRDRDEARAS